MDAIKSTIDKIADVPIGIVSDFVPSLPCVKKGAGYELALSMALGNMTSRSPLLRSIGATTAVQVPVVGPMVAPLLTPTVHYAIAGALPSIVVSGLSTGALSANSICGAVFGVLGAQIQFGAPA